MIRFTDVHKTYKSGVEALKGISFDIADGEFVFIIGKSGSGKSTLMKCITCEERPTEGTVTIDGFNISSMSRALVPVLRREIGMIYQDFRLIESKTVAENIAFAGEIIGIPRKTLNQSVQLMLNLVGLKDKASAYPQELSGGEQQRVAIARAMLNNPQIIVADEPTGNLDPETSENIMALLQEINRNGSTVIVCTHDSNLVDRMKKRVIEISDGLIARDAEDSLYKEAEAVKPQIMPEAAAPQMAIAFGDDPAFDTDREYADGFDDDGYNRVDVSQDFFFGETPEMPTPAPAKAPEIAAEAEVEPSEEPLVEEAVSAAVSTEVQELVSFEELPVEEIEALPVEEDTNSSTEEVVETNEAEDASKVEEETSDEAAKDVQNKDEAKEDDDSWIKEIELSDIDLDIQEDDD